MRILSSSFGTTGRLSFGGVSREGNLGGLRANFSPQRSDTEDASSQLPEVPESEVNIRTCCRYQMYGEFLGDGETGDVWKYNNRKKNLELVEREEDDFGKLMEVVAGYETVDYLQSTGQDIAQRVHHSERKRYEEVIAATVKVIDEKVEGILNHIR